MRRVIAFLIFPALLLALVGCDLQIPIIEREVIAQEAPPQGGHSQEGHTLQEAAATPTPLIEPQKVCLWARQQLSVQAQDTYDRLAAAIACRQTEAVEVESDAEEVQLVLTALRIDHPEYFWFNGEATYVTSAVPLLGQSLSCVLSYTMEEEEIRQRLGQVEQYVYECLTSPELQSAKTDYEKILGVYRYIISHTDYVLSSTDQSMIGVMTDRQGTCAGYARTFEYLMHCLDIPCTLALGQGSKGESHGWNVVQCGGKWYHIDVTWGDPVDENGLPGASLSYTYCMVTDGVILRDHTLSEEIVMPPCEDTEFNYFRQSGRYLTCWDPSVYEELLSQAADQGEKMFSVQFQTLEDYEAAISSLIDQGQILELLMSQGLSVPEDGITYSQNEQFLEFSVQIPS